MRSPDELMEAHFDGNLDNEGFQALQDWLRSDEANRVRFLRESALRGELRQVLALDGRPRGAERSAFPRRMLPWALAALLAVGAILGLLHLGRGDDGGVRIDMVEGEVLAERGGERHALHAGERIAAGTTVTTGHDGEVALRMDDGSRLVLGGGGALRRGGGDGPAWFLDDGHLDADFAHQPPGHPCILRTPSTDVVVVGTSFACAVGTGATHLRMEEGCVRLHASTGAEADCRTGQMAVVDTDGIRLRDPDVVAGPLTAPVSPPGAPVAAFTGATGFGAASLGGRGGRVIPVTTLADDGPGSLREAVAADGPRVIVFRVSGTIALQTPLRIRNGRVTIAGQTAPGDGICLRNATVEVGWCDRRAHQAHGCDDVVIRHLRLRPGDLGADGRGGNHVNGLGILAGNRIIIDHCSISWSGNKAIRSGVDGEAHDIVRNLTIQDCLIAETLHGGGPAADQARGFALQLGGTDVSLHRNVIAHVYSYAPKPCGNGVFDCRNNLIYNWIHKGPGYINDADEGLHLNYLGNLLRAGPDSPRDGSLAFRSLKGSAGICVHDLAFLRHDGTWNTSIPGLMVSTTGQHLTSSSWPAPDCALMPARELMTRLLPRAGADRPHRDGVDARICDEVGRGVGRVIATMRGQRDWPELRTGSAIVDSDGDGLPDDWERAHGLDPADAVDGSRVGSDGLSALDRYLDELARP